MRFRAINILFLVLFISAAVAREGELDYGVMGGLNLAQFSQKWPGSTSNNRFKPAFLLGGYAQTALHPHLGMRGEFLYTQKGNRIESAVGSSTIYTDYLLHYLSLNITAQYTPVERLVLYFGPQASYLLSAGWETTGDTEETSGDVTNEFKALEIGVIGGLSYQFLENFELQFRYEFGLSNLFAELAEQYTLHNRVMSFILGYRFND